MAAGVCHHICSVLALLVFEKHMALTCLFCCCARCIHCLLLRYHFPFLGLQRRHDLFLGVSLHNTPALQVH